MTSQVYVGVTYLHFGLRQNISRGYSVLPYSIPGYNEEQGVYFVLSQEPGGVWGDYCLIIEYPGQFTF